MAKDPKYSDFYGQLTRREGRGWGANVTRNSVAADSDFMLDSDRLRTQSVYEPSAQEKRVAKKVRRGQDLTLNAPVPAPGRFVQRPVSVPDARKRFMGKQRYTSVYKGLEEE